MNNNTFDLKKFRKANKLSQTELAEILGVTQGFISRVEIGAAPIPNTMLDAIFARTDWKVPADVIAIAGLKEKEETSEPVGHFVGTAALTEKIKLMERLLEEKERTIRILERQLSLLCHSEDTSTH